MKYNLHTHTVRCNHATGEDREYVENAIKAGIKVLGFADHCPQFFPTRDYYSYFRMRPEQAQEYAESIRALKKEYKRDIKILLGFETEYYPETYDAFIQFVRPLHLDYLIMGQHFVGNEYDEGSYYAAQEGKKEQYLDQYVNQVKEGLQKGVFTYLAHPDIVWYCGDRSYYEKRITELCRFAKDRDIPLGGSGIHQRGAGVSVCQITLDVGKVKAREIRQIRRVHHVHTHHGIAATAEVEGAFLADAPEDTGDDCDIHAVILLQM